MRVTTAEFIKRYGTLADRALGEPVTIIKNGRDRLVLLSADARLKRRDRRAIAAEELTEAELELIASAEVPAEHAHLDAEMTASPESRASALTSRSSCRSSSDQSAS